jgi:hypothetical protein
MEKNLKENFLIVRSACQLLRRGGFALKEIPSTVLSLIQKDAWRDFITESGRSVHHDTFESFVVTPPLEGLGATVRQIEQLCRDDVEALRAVREVKKHQGKRADNFVDNINEVRSSGTSTSYTLSRLSRESPDLYEQVRRGDLSANAAAIKAGFRRKTWTAPADVKELASVIAKRYPGWRLVRDN